jgi:hypothetical protein
LRAKDPLPCAAPTTWEAMLNLAAIAAEVATAESF